MIEKAHVVSAVEDLFHEQTQDECVGFFFFFEQKTAYEMRISDWSSDVCSSDLRARSSRWWCAASARRSAPQAARWRRCRARRSAAAQVRCTDRKSVV